MTALELTEDEARELSTALEIRIHGLRAELAAADARAYRAELRRTLERVEQIAAHLADRLQGGADSNAPVTAPV